MYRCDWQSYETPEEALAVAITASGTAAFVPAVLDYLRTIAPFLGAFVTLLEGRNRPVHIYDNVRAERRAEVIDRWIDAAYLLDPFYEAYLRDQSCRLMSLAEAAPDGFRQSTYFRRYYGTVRLQDEIAIFVDLPADQGLFYSIGRRTEERRFGRREIAAMRRALPVFAALNRSHFGSGRYRRTGIPGTESSVEDAMASFGANSLTPRERELAVLILKGHSSNSIAHLAEISPGTVKIHRKNIYRKLQISSQSELFSLFLTSLQA